MTLPSRHFTFTVVKYFLPAISHGLSTIDDGDGRRWIAVAYLVVSTSFSGSIAIDCIPRRIGTPLSQR